MLEKRIWSGPCSVQYLSHNKRLILLTVSVALLLAACGAPKIYSSQPLSESVIYMSDGIENSKIQMVWLEVPTHLKSGDVYVRLFLAKHEPPEPTIPNPNDLRCTLASDDEFALLGPEKSLFELMEDGSFTGIYTYRAGPDCIECYMNWDYTLEMTGAINGETVLLDIAIVHFGHNVQGSYLSTTLTSLKNNKEPQMKCNRLIECSKVKFIDVK